MQGRRGGDRQVALGLAAILVAGTFLFDLELPLGIAMGMPYATLPLLGLLIRDRWLVIGLAAAGLVLTAMGLFLSPAGSPLHIALLNRSMSAALIVLVTAIALRHLAVGDEFRERLEAQALRDPLTGLYNRRHVFAVVENSLNRYRRYGERFAVILIDADHFKRVNDRYGHPAGDRVLQLIAAVCRESVRNIDIVGRFGGEEFIVVLPHSDAAAAAIVAERIRNTMQQSALDTDQGRVTVTLSLGVAEAGLESETFDDILREADRSLYRAKRAGRNRVAGPAGTARTLKRVETA